MTKLVKLLLVVLLFYVNIVNTVFPRMGDSVDTKWLVFYLLSLAFVLFVAMRRKIVVPGKWLIIIILFCSIVFLSILWSPFYSYDASTIIHFVARYIAPVLLVLIASNVICDEKEFDFYTKNFTIVATIIGCIAIGQSLFFPASLKMSPEGFRATATFENPNTLAIFLVIAIPSVLNVIEHKLFPRLIGYGMLSLITISTILTFSRKGIVTLTLCTLLYYFLKSYWKKFIILCLLTIIIITTVTTLNSLSPRFNDRILEREWKGKINLASTGIAMFSINPLIGMGYLGYYENFGKFTKNFETKKYDAHNMYITVLADQGILGFIPFMSILLFPLFLSIKTWKNRDGFEKHIAIICITTIVPFMINGFYAGAMFVTQSIIFIFYAQVSICLTTIHIGKEKKNIGNCIRQTIK